MHVRKLFKLIMAHDTSNVKCRPVVFYVFINITDRINGLDAMFAFAGSKECGLPLMMVKLVDIMTGTRRESNSEKIGGLELLLKVLQHIESDHEYAILTDSLNAPTVESVNF